MEVAIVVQRYGKQIVGGAESHARQVAEKLSANLGWKVHVYTTTARDYRTWKNHFPEGLETVNGVLIHRFNCVRSRNPFFFDLVNGFLTKIILILGRFFFTRPLARTLEVFWYQIQGPLCPGLIKELSEQHKYLDQIFFFTYLYYPTIKGLPLLRDKSTLIPTAHNEPPFRFLHTKALFQNAQRILANTEAEAFLIASLYPGTKERTQVVGLGFDELSLDPDNLSSLFTSPIEEPYVIYLGRISRGKKVDVLIGHFLKYLEMSQDKKTKLALAGEVEEGMKIPRHPQIKTLGFVAEDRKAKLIARAKCLVNPSPQESLSMVVVEGLALKVPILVNAESEVLAYYAKHHPSVFSYHNSDEFGAALGQIVKQDWHQDEALKHALDKGRSWAIAKFSWDKVLSSYQAVIEQR